jgi:hypothetical protein
MSHWAFSNANTAVRSTKVQQMSAHGRSEALIPQRIVRRVVR